MKLKYEFEEIDMGDDIVLVPVGKGATDLHGILKVNTSALMIIRELKNDTSIDLIVHALEKEYDDNREALTGFVSRTIDELRKADCIVE